MDIKYYIDSGILELYVLDQLNPIEKRDVESMAKEFPEIALELSSIETAFENIALINKGKPNKELKDKIASRLIFNDPIQKQSPKIVRIGWYITSLAACFILLLISCLLLWDTYNRLEITQNKYQLVLHETEKYASQTKEVSNRLAVTINSLVDTNSVFLRLKGTSQYPSVNVALFWNKKEHYLKLISSNFPKNKVDQTYQLWALVKGKPYSMGIFDGDSINRTSILNKDKAFTQAFAITLEPKGGSLSPHLDKMVVMGLI